jgi:putative glutamine amidotransferase
MDTSATPIRIGIHGLEESPNQDNRGCGLWAPGYAAAVTAAGGTPVHLGESARGRSLNDLLDDVDGLVFTGERRNGGQPTTDEDRLCKWCRKRRLPLLAVDEGLLALNVVFGGSIYLDLPRELPDALQHRHPPEPGVRHAITVTPGTHLCELYGDGEIVVNSEHHRAIERLAKGFRVGARALDGVIEAVEFEADDWFAMGVQWRPASGTASGLDIQLFRGLVDAARARQEQRLLRTCGAAA